jgi:hypothetical protein
MSAKDRRTTPREHTMTTTQRILTTIGLTLTAAALFVGLMPLHYQGTSCGTAWHGTSAAETADWVRVMAGQPGGLSDVEDGCQAARQPLAVGGGALLILGVGTLIAGAVARPGA